MSKKTQILNSLRDYDISSEIFRNEDVSSIQSRIEKLFRQYEIGYYAINYNISPTIIRFEIIPESGFHILAKMFLSGAKNLELKKEKIN